MGGENQVSSADARAANRKLETYHATPSIFYIRELDTVCWPRFARTHSPVLSLSVVIKPVPCGEVRL